MKFHRSGGLSLFLAVSLSSCQALPGAGKPPLAGEWHPAGAPALPANLAQPRPPSAPVPDRYAIRGRVAFPAPRQVQAAADYAINSATLTLVSLSDNLTVVTGYTNTDGTFALGLNGFTPSPNTFYLLESTRGLNNHAAGNEVARFRTFLQWTGTTWTSTSGTTILINSQTTAMAIISSLDSATVTPASTIGKVSGSTIAASPAPAAHPVSAIDALAKAILAYLTNDFDPVRATPHLKPSITSLEPETPVAGGALMIKGKGFSPIQTGNTVTVGGKPASVFSASPTALGIYLPVDAPSSGQVSVTTSLGTSTEAAVFTLAGTPSGGGGGGGGGASGLAIKELTPASAAPGSTVMIRGSGFSKTASENTVKFNGVTAQVTYADSETLIVTVPANLTSGPLTVTVGGETKGYYFASLIPTISSFLPTSGNEAVKVTINGQNFGTQSSSSAVRFNGLTTNNLVSWFGTEAVVYPLAPNTTGRVSGPLTLVSSEGVISASGGDFTARKTIVEKFANSNFKDNDGTTATWGGGMLRIGGSTTLNVPFGSGTDTRETGGTVQLDGPGTPGNLRHNGVSPSCSWSTQMGVDATHYYVPVSCGYATIYKYSLANGSQVASSNRSGVSGVIWDALNQLYITLGGGWINGNGFTNSWDGPNDGQFGGHGNLSATNGKYFFGVNTWRGFNFVGLGKNGTNLNGNYGNLGIAWTSQYDSAAGLVGSDRFFYIQGNPGGISALSTATVGGSIGSIALPFNISGSGLNSGVPVLGSDGYYLYIIGRNSSYNSNNITLFRFGVSGNTIKLQQAFDETGNTISPVIDLPADTNWDTVNFSTNVPAGTSLTIDVLDGATGNALLSNVTSGRSLSSLTAKSLKLRANFTAASGGTATPKLLSWNIKTRGIHARSLGYDTGTTWGEYEAPAVTASDANYDIEYSDSADNATWGNWTSSPTGLSRRYIRWKITFKSAATEISQISMPYTY